MVMAAAEEEEEEEERPMCDGAARPSPVTLVQRVGGGRSNFCIRRSDIRTGSSSRAERTILQPTTIHSSWRHLFLICCALKSWSDALKKS